MCDIIFSRTVKTVFCTLLKKAFKKTQKKERKYYESMEKSS